MTDQIKQARSVSDQFTAPLSDGQIGALEQLRTESAMFKVLTDAMPQMVWSTLPDGFHDYYNARWYEFTGMPPGSTDGEGWNGMFHADDQDRAWERWRHSLDTGEPYEIEYRLRHHSGDYRWVLGRALPVRTHDGKIVRWIGTCTDIDAAKRQADLADTLSRELSHRIKNIFAVISGLVALSAADHPEARDYASVLQARITSLGRAHEFVRPHSDQSAPQYPASTLHAMVTDLLGAYPALTDGRITITGDDVPIDDTGATPLALALHELATNAAKYGALATADGILRITTSLADDQLTLDWQERNGPPVMADPTHTGFGRQLVEISVVSQLGGTLDYDWAADGLGVAIRVAPDRLVRVRTPAQTP
jgi:PAS domain S-box-containing protein